jgi:beta-glucosidase
MAGRTYRYYTGEPLYPFGYGLSYTTFHYETLTVSPKTIAAGSEANVTATVTVTNTGSFAADEVGSEWVHFALYIWGRSLCYM